MEPANSTTRIAQKVKSKTKNKKNKNHQRNSWLSISSIYSSIKVSIQRKRRALHGLISPQDAHEGAWSAASCSFASW